MDQAPLYDQLARRKRRRRGALAASAIVPVTIAASASLGVDLWPWGGEPPAGPEAAAAAFASAWNAGDPTDGPLVGDAEQLRAAYTATVDGLSSDAPTVELVEVLPTEEDQDIAEATFEVVWPLDGHEAWSYTTSAWMRRSDGDDGWLVSVEPSTIHPDLGDGDVLRQRRLRPQRGDILGGDDQPLVTNRPVVDIGVQPSRVTDPVALTTALEDLLDIDADGLLERIDAADDDAFVPVITLREPDHEEVAEELQALQGTVVTSDSLPLAPTRGFARALLGTAGPVTAELLEDHPQRYHLGDTAGLSGLQRRFDDELFGRPGVEVLAAPGADVVGEGTERTLHRVDPEPGAPVRVTLDERVQLAADAALADVTYPSALVAIRVEDGHVLAVANGPGTDGAEVALTGQYPPGSTFKVVTTAALLERGLTPDTPVACSRRATVDGYAFSNAEDGELGDVPFRTAFAESCNTAFVELSSQLADDALREASVPFGIGAGHDLGVGAYRGQVPDNDGVVDRAASTIGQGRVLASPLSVADMAATVARGHHVTPTLLLDPAADEPDDIAPLDADTVAALRELLREVVTSGSGTALADVPGPAVHGKTGTAEYGTDDPPRTHAWFAGYQGDIAVAVLVAETEDAFGGRVAAPIAADFLRRLHS